MIPETDNMLDLHAYVHKLEVDNQRLQASLDSQHQLLERIKLDALKELLSNLSHDFRTPLTSIRNSIYLLRKLDDEEKREHYLDILQEQSEHLEQLLLDVCSLTRLDTQVTIFEIQRANINVLLEAVLKNLAPLIEEKRHTVVCNFAPDLPLTLVDESKMARAFHHIIENALYYTPPGGQVMITTSIQGEHLIVEVIDNGMGISYQALARIFDTFYREDKARSTATGRAGLGLAIARRIIENHSGSIDVESEVGVGSTFRVFLIPLH